MKKRIPTLSNSLRVIKTSKHRKMVTKLINEFSSGKRRVADSKSVDLVIDIMRVRVSDKKYAYPSYIKKSELEKNGIRMMKKIIVRAGAHISRGVVLMPFTFINIGVSVGKNTMIDTGASIGSGAQIGKNVHISGKVSIGGVLEPRQDKPVIIEDNCFIGALSSIAEGAHIGKGAVLAVGTVVNSGIKIFDCRRKGKKAKKVKKAKEMKKGYIPPNVLAVPATYPDECGLNFDCVAIIKNLTSKTKRKTVINNMLRDEKSTKK